MTLTYLVNMKVNKEDGELSLINWVSFVWICNEMMMMMKIMKILK